MSVVVSSYESIFTFIIGISKFSFTVAYLKYISVLHLCLTNCMWKYLIVIVCVCLKLYSVNVLHYIINTSNLFTCRTVRNLLYWNRSAWVRLEMIYPSLSTFSLWLQASPLTSFPLQQIPYPPLHSFTSHTARTDMHKKKNRFVSLFICIGQSIQAWHKKGKD